MTAETISILIAEMLDFAPNFNVQKLVNERHSAYGIKILITHSFILKTGKLLHLEECASAEGAEVQFAFYEDGRFEIRFEDIEE
jgi:hypothetical protein